MSIDQPDMTEPERRAKAIRAIAGAAHDADDLRELLDMLGLDPAESLPPEQRPKPVVPVQRHKGQGIPITELAEMLAAAGFDRDTA
ncbi:hypothetical protein HFP15_02845 [Amycolatopsis sp. K13G38]|uniref:Uncharacterized protein n=1 Tax=Amycolatopsis acididurans TaxID=2724524 RepID=A0ABX1J0B6_9PSEU|nr:hypothetical protein [Amycolatopsis acididurans]NKQ51815.1 hypothetical protein [Amycolatopsis acididurans]